MNCFWVAADMKTPSVIDELEIDRVNEIHVQILCINFFLLQ